MTVTSFDDMLDEYLGDGDALTDIRLTVRRAWFYDFDGYPTRLWQGQGRLFTSDGEVWLGSIDGSGKDHHVTPAIQDGRDGSSASYNFSMTIPDFPGLAAGDTYNSLKEDQWRVFNRSLTCYLVLFKEGEALRPITPIRYFKQLTMQSPTFSEALVDGGGGILQRTYTVSLGAKDANLRRSATPNRTYSDTGQREHAVQMGVTSPVDKGCEFVALLANKTFVVP